MDRDEALQLLKKHVKKRANLDHARESEAVMRAMAERLGEDPDKWGICGLLHDIDWEECGEDATKHAAMGRQMLLDAGVDEEIAHAVGCHNHEYNGCDAPDTLMAKALVPCETVTGLIVASVLVRPNKDIGAMKLKSIKKKFKDKSFARNCDRDAIRKCEELGVELPDFLEMARDAIAGVQDDLEVG
ncbi:MAG: HDIG domain-containing protein [Planctomycetota bacterium]|nr:HDIG domain-containing protein [Planctomycetota bacterium]